MSNIIVHLQASPDKIREAIKAIPWLRRGLVGRIWTWLVG